MGLNGESDSDLFCKSYTLTYEKRSFIPQGKDLLSYRCSALMAGHSYGLCLPFPYPLSLIPLKPKPRTTTPPNSKI